MKIERYVYNSFEADQIRRGKVRSGESRADTLTEDAVVFDKKQHRDGENNPDSSFNNHPKRGHYSSKSDLVSDKEEGADVLLPPLDLRA